MAVALAAVALAGCGGSGTDTPAATTTPSDEPPIVLTTAPVKTTITITAPKAGATVSAAKPIVVHGRATPDATVLLAAGCFKDGCQAIARANGQGRWSARLTVAAPKATIEASTASSEPLDSVKITVTPPKKLQTSPPVKEVEPTVEARTPPQRVYMVGDSLAVGTEPSLAGLLGMPVQTDAKIGRPLATGMGIISGLDLRSQPTALAVSLFTNDDPTRVDALESAVRTTVNAVGPQGCAIWATIVRPPLNGVPYTAANARLLALESELPNLRIVPWAESVAADPDLLADDGVHGTPAGYRARAALYAQAVASCG